MKSRHSEWEWDERFFIEHNSQIQNSNIILMLKSLKFMMKQHGKYILMLQNENI